VAQVAVVHQLQMPLITQGLLEQRIKGMRVQTERMEVAIGVAVEAALVLLVLLLLLAETVVKVFTLQLQALMFNAVVEAGLELTLQLERVVPVAVVMAVLKV
jgi:hypothetical protein